MTRAKGGGGKATSPTRVNGSVPASRTQSVWVRGTAARTARERSSAERPTMRTLRIAGRRDCRIAERKGERAFVLPFLQSYFLQSCKAGLCYCCAVSLG